jgi:hypothetical protein
VLPSSARLLHTAGPRWVGRCPQRSSLLGACWLLSWCTWCLCSVFQPLLLLFPAPSRSPSSRRRSCGPSSPPSPLSGLSLVSLLSRGLCALSACVWWGPCCAFYVGPSPV